MHEPFLTQSSTSDLAGIRYVPSIVCSVCCSTLIQAFILARTPHASTEVLTYALELKHRPYDCSTCLAASSGLRTLATEGLMGMYSDTYHSYNRV